MQPDLEAPMETDPQQSLLSCEEVINSLKAALIKAEQDDIDFDVDDVMNKYTDLAWQSEDEFLDFFEEISVEIARSASICPNQQTAEIFGCPIYYGLCLGSPYYSLWEQALKTKSSRLAEAINIEEWGTYVAGELKELSLIMMIPLATAYELPVFESLRNRAIVNPSEAEEEFLGYVAAALAPGYFNDTLPAEILFVPSSQILCEILEDWTQYRELWTPSNLEGLLSCRSSSKYITKDVRDLIARVLKGEDPYNPDEWESQREEYWSDEEVQEILDMLVKD